MLKNNPTVLKRRYRLLEYDGAFAAVHVVIVEFDGVLGADDATRVASEHLRLLPVREISPEGLAKSLRNPRPSIPPACLADRNREIRSQ